MATFVDEAQIHVKGGDGGAGCVSFRREAYVTRGGPDGGDGGDGGSVWLVADPNVSSLLGFHDQPFRRAPNGTHGKGAKRHGHRGESITVAVPIGTTVRSLQGEVLADLSEPGVKWRAAEGGRGGHGNAKFLSNRRRAPHFAEQGEVGEEFWFDLELKLVADVALVGLPNTGKSTLVSVMSAAKPKIADYPFTTLVPNLGVARYDDTDFVIADVPGLIEGAALGKGLGHQFLRHVERARVLAIVVDLAPAHELTPDEQINVLVHELEAYRPDLLERPRVVVGNKADVTEFGPDQFDGLRVSGATREGIHDLLGQLAHLVTGARAEVAVVPSSVVLTPAASGVVVRRGDDGAFHVEGRDARRAVALSDLTDFGALQVARARLNNLGVDRALVKAGAVPGDRVIVGGVEFEFDPGAL